MSDAAHSSLIRLDPSMDLPYHFEFLQDETLPTNRRLGFVIPTTNHLNLYSDPFIRNLTNRKNRKGPRSSLDPPNEGNNPRQRLT